MDYLQGHKESGLKVGDKVRIIRKASDYENGWRNIWPSFMDKYIREIGKIIKDHEAIGFGVTFSDGVEFSYPFFVLEKVLPIAKSTTKRSRVGLKVPAYVVCFTHGRRTIISTTWTYGRNGDAFIAQTAKNNAEVDAKKCQEWQPWIERGFVILRTPRKKV